MKPLLALALLGLGACSAPAEVPRIRIRVEDFDDRSGHRDGTPGREVTEAVRAELAASGRVEVLAAGGSRAGVQYLLSGAVLGFASRIEPAGAAWRQRTECRILLKLVEVESAEVSFSEEIVGVSTRTAEGPTGYSKEEGLPAMKDAAKQGVSLLLAALRAR